jgi:hypothetical protein
MPTAAFAGDGLVGAEEPPFRCADVQTGEQSLIRFSASTLQGRLFGDPAARRESW